MNWGRGILIVIIVFLTAMCSMVYIATKQTNDLIDDNYYEKEVAFQSQINGELKVNAVCTSSLIAQDDKNISVTLPKALSGKVTEGTVVFLRSDDESKDVSATLEPGTETSQVVSKEKIEKGFYTARIKWKNNDTLCYREEKLYVKK